MATHEKYSKYITTPFWKSNEASFRNLEYIQEEFNDVELLAKWRAQGLPEPFTGYMCDMRSPQTYWNYRILRMFEKYGWKDIGTSYYRMDGGTNLPTHGDLYKRYIELHNLQGMESRIKRAIIFLEDSKPGHYIEICNDRYEQWDAGTVIEWDYDTPHAAGNAGTEPRYTLQITGWV